MIQRCSQKLVVVLAVGLAFTWIAESGTFTEYCDRIRRCDMGVSLVCRNEVCECIKPDIMTFSSEAKRCIVLARQKCKYPIECESSDQTYSEYDEVDSCYAYDDCGPNSTCNSDGVCACNENYFETMNGTCGKLGGYGENCNETGNCRPDLFLVCSNHKCQCDPSSAIVKSTHKNKPCAGLVGKPCLNEMCVENAHCDDTSGSPGICKCVHPFMQSDTGSGFCHSIGYEGKCSNHDGLLKCHKNFSCREGICKCKYDEEHQFYQTDMNVCISFVKGPCQLIGPESQCSSNAECVANPRTGLPECHCKPPFVEGVDGFCEKLDYNAPCGDSEIRCDPRVPLVCRDGKCDCGDDLKAFDWKERRCRRLVGSFCDDDKSCVENAFCRKPFNQEDSKGRRGQCECASLENQTANRTCNGTETAIKLEGGANVN